MDTAPGPSDRLHQLGKESFSSAQSQGWPAFPGETWWRGEGWATRSSSRPTGTSRHLPAPASPACLPFQSLQQSRGGDITVPKGKGELAQDPRPSPGL